MLTNLRRTLTLAVVACASTFAASHRNGPLLLEDQTANLNELSAACDRLDELTQTLAQYEQQRLRILEEMTQPRSDGHD